MDKDTVIKVEHVSKDFVLPHLRVNSVKGLFTGLTSHSGEKSREIQHALKDISFEVKSGEFFGIVGRNGSGKSTMLKILANIYTPNKGSVQVSGRLVPFIELGVGFNPELTGRENVYLNGAMLGFSQKEISAMYNDIVAFAELENFMDQKLKNYSSGMQVRLAFSMATRSQADILLVDEVLAVGDADFQRKCFAYFKELKRIKKTVVFVSHDMNAVREFCDRALLIENSRAVSIGRATDISHKYSQLFVSENMENTKAFKDANRWGTGEARFGKVSAEIKGENIVVKAQLSATEDTGEITYGLHVVAADGIEVVATNNILINQPKIKAMKKGDTADIIWEFLNVFSDGKYTITITLIDDVAKTLDWLTEAAEFTVKRHERAATAVMPPMSVKIKY